MSTHDVTIKAYEEKVSALLQQIRAQLGEFEARGKGKFAQAEIDTIQHLKTKHHDIDKKRELLKTVGEAKAGQVKAEIDAEISKLKASVAELAAKASLERKAG
jgi:hypothetical protein